METSIEKYKRMIESNEVFSADDWMSLAASLLWDKHKKEDERLAREIIASKKLKDLRPEKKSRTDAEIDWRVTDEYRDWQAMESLVDSLSSFAAIARNRANMLKNF